MEPRLNIQRIVTHDFHKSMPAVTSHQQLHHCQSTAKENKRSVAAEMGDRLATIETDRKLGAVHLFWGAGFPSNTTLPGPRSTSIPSRILIHPAIWPQQTWAENWGAPFLGGGWTGSPHNTLWPGLRSTFVPSDILIHTAVIFFLLCPIQRRGAGSPCNTMWPGSRPTFIHNRHGPKSVGLLCPFLGEREQGAHLTQCGCGKGQGLPPCKVSSWSIQPFGHNTPSQTDRQDKRSPKNDWIQIREKHKNLKQSRVWAYAQRDGSLRNIGGALPSPADGQTSCKVWLISVERHRCSKKPRGEPHWNFLGCPKLPNASQPLVG